MENEKNILHKEKILRYDNVPFDDMDNLLELLESMRFSGVVKYYDGLQIRTFKMGYLQKDKNADGYFTIEEAISKGRAF